MPIHLEELDVTSKVAGLDSALITACNMCAGASLAMNENKPFLEFFKSRFKSPPLERYIGRLQSELSKKGIRSAKFQGGVIQQFFLCLWTSRQRTKLKEIAKQYDAVIVLGCKSAVETVNETLQAMNCKVIKGMEVAGIMNTKTRFHLPFDISFEYSEVIPMCDHHCEKFSRQPQQ
jgi:hypothetical protein